MKASKKPRRSEPATVDTAEPAPVRPHLSDDRLKEFRSLQTEFRERSRKDSKIFHATFQFPTPAKVNPSRDARVLGYGMGSYGNKLELACYYCENRDAGAKAAHQDFVRLADSAGRA